MLCKNALDQCEGRDQTPSRKPALKKISEMPDIAEVITKAVLPEILEFMSQARMRCQFLESI